MHEEAPSFMQFVLNIVSSLSPLCVLLPTTFSLSLLCQFSLLIVLY